MILPYFWLSYISFSASTEQAWQCGFNMSWSLVSGSEVVCQGGMDFTCFLFGFEWLPTFRLLVDVNECTETPLPCQYGCTNTVGSYTCTCMYLYGSSNSEAKTPVYLLHQACAHVHLLPHLSMIPPRFCLATLDRTLT